VHLARSRNDWIDLTVALVLAGLIAVELAAGGRELYPRMEAVQYAGGGLMGMALLGRRRYPLNTMTVEALLFAGVAAVVGHSTEVLFEGVAMLVAAYSVAVFAEFRLAVAGLTLGLVGATLRSVFDPSLDWASTTIDSMWLVPPWVVGLVVRGHRTRADTATETERLRIAREMHDVVAHGLGVMVLHARGGRRNLDTNPAAAREAFDTIVEAGEQALDEMRRLLGVLRGREGGDEADRSPAPGLSALPGLVEGFRDAGLPTRLDLEETRGLSPGLELTVFRIVQESLTNSARHGGQAATVRLRRIGRDLHLDIEDTGGGSAQGPGSGNGLEGIRERVQLYGGTVSSGPRPEGGYLVRVAIPLRGA
jgi:signal transduction histidine kinase